MFRLIKATWQRGLHLMDVILHLGAHRCATTSFQAYLDQNRQRLMDQRVGVWTPQDTRRGLFEGLTGRPANGAEHQVARLRAQQAALDVDQLIITEENMIGAPRNNLNHNSLYPELTQRLARFSQAFEGRVSGLGLAIRSYESYWRSVMTFATMRGAFLPAGQQCAELAAQPRTWTDIAQDIRALFPSVPLHIWTFDAFAARPQHQLTMLSKRPIQADLLDQTTMRKNTSCSLKQMRRQLTAQGRMEELGRLPQTGAWHPFSPLQRHQMAQHYATDLNYFRSGTDPQISFQENAAINVQRSKNMQGPPAFDIGEHHERHAKMG